MLMLETDDEIVCVPHDDHVARGLAMSPSVGPEVEHVVKVHVRKKRRNHRALPRARVTHREPPVSQPPPLKPFLDQVDHASISNPMLQETNQPLLVDRIKEASEVRVKNIVHLRAVDTERQGIKRIIRVSLPTKLI